MSGNRKLGRVTSHRLSMLRGIVTTLIVKGRVETTYHRALEAQKIAEKLITLGVREHMNFETREIVVSKAKLDANGKKVLVSKTSKNGKTYDVVERVMSTKEVQVDKPSRLAARRKMMKWLLVQHDENGNKITPTNILFSDVAPRYVSRNGGYTRITKLGARRGDAAERAVLELI